MIPTLAFTIFTESLVALGVCIWRHKPFGPILGTSLLANLLTQSMLWAGLNLFHQHYRVALLAAEVLIWLVESLLLYFVRANRLNAREALSLSLGMNLTSLALGWFLPL